MSALAAADHDPAAAHHLFTLPNIITLARLCAVPATVWLMLHQRLDLAFILFVAAAASDAIDGWLARAMKLQSTLGALLDPVADKALLISVYVILAALGVLPDWLAILVVFRDLMIMGGLVVLWFLGLRPPIAPLLVSKLNTFSQLALAAAAMGSAGFGLDGGVAVSLLIAVAAATTIASGAAYLRGAARLMAGRA